MDVQVPGWMTTEFSVVRSDGSTAIVRNDFVESFHRHRLIDCPSAPHLSVPDTEDERADARAVPGGGRGPVRIISAGPLGEAVVRPYRRGGWVERINRRTYFFGNRAFHELVSTYRLWKRGAPVPEVLAAVQSRAGLGYRACLVTRRVPRTRPAARVLASAAPPLRGRTLECVGRSIRLFHEAGGVHADLNAFNVLVQEDGEEPAVVIDLDRAAVLTGPASGRRARANLRRLRRSFVKLGLTDALADWPRLEGAYAAPPEPPPAA